MHDVAPISNDAEHEIALTRARQLFGSPRESAEGAELRALATVIHDYEAAKFPPGPNDAPDEIEYLLDQREATLDELYSIFGGRDAFIDFMTRRQPLDDATIDVLVANYNTKREWLERPFRASEGWQDITKFDDIPWRAEPMKFMPVAAAAH